MDEEIDYMSDEFIKNCVESADVRPGLLRTHNEQRQHDLMRKKKLESENKKIPTEILQVEVLQESLKQPIKDTNKGFSLLQKMGFKSGMGLGKNNSGITEPIGINIKNDKKGLGHKAPKQQKKIENKLDNLNEAEFRAFVSKKKRDQMVLSDFRKSQRICKELDTKSERSTAKESWFWPEEDSSDCSEEEDKDSEEVELSNEEKLEMLTRYLRENYFYCIWCKIQYEDEKDLEGCPGPTRDDH